MDCYHADRKSSPGVDRRPQASGTTLIELIVTSFLAAIALILVLDSLANFASTTSGRIDHAFTLRESLLVIQQINNDLDSAVADSENPRVPTGHRALTLTVLRRNRTGTDAAPVCYRFSKDTGSLERSEAMQLYRRLNHGPIESATFGLERVSQAPGRTPPGVGGSLITTEVFAWVVHCSLTGATSTAVKPGSQPSVSTFVTARVIVPIRSGEVPDGWIEPEYTPDQRTEK